MLQCKGSISSKERNTFGEKSIRGSTHILTFLYVKRFSKLNIAYFN